MSLFDRTASTVAALVVAATVLGTAASCSASGASGVPRMDDASTDTAVPMDEDASVDACEGGRDRCAPRDPCEDIEWCPVETGVDPSFAFGKVWGSGPNDVWAVGSKGGVLHWNGSAWNFSQVPTEQTLVTVWGSGPSDVWIASTATLFFHSTGFSNGSTNLTAVPAVATEAGDTRAVGKLIRAIWGTSPSDIWVGGDSFNPGTAEPWPALAGVWRGTLADGGTGWTSVSTLPVYAIWGSGSGDIWTVGPAVDASGNALRDGSSSARMDGNTTTDGGAPVWTSVDPQTSQRLYAVWGSGPNDVWAVGHRGTIQHIAKGDESWSSVDSPTVNALRALWGSGPNDVWAVGDEGTIVHYDGTQWRTSTSTFPAGNVPDLLGVWGSGPNDVWAVGGGRVLHFSGSKPRTQGERP